MLVERYAGLSLIRKHPKNALETPIASVHPAILEKIRTNLVTYFSLYTMLDLDDRELPTPTEPPSLHPGTILNHKTGPICVIDHWGCFNDYPVIYVAPVGPDLMDPCPLDVEISSQYRDLFTKRNFVRTDDLFLIDRQELQTPSDRPPLILRYGLLRKISRALILKFGQKSLLL